MGLKLKSQIAGILFLLFTLTVVILGYFNMSILFDAMKSLSEQQAAALAGNVVSWVEKTMPLDGYNEQYLRLRMAQRGDLPDYLKDVRGLRCFQIMDPAGNVIFAYGPLPDRYPNQSQTLLEAFRDGRPTGHLWEYESPNDWSGHPLSNGGLLMPRYLSFEYFEPVIDKGAPVGVYHVSLDVEEMPRRLRIMFLGNLLLSVVFLITAFIAISIWTANAINRPLEFLLQAQDRIGRGDFNAHVQLDMPSTNEIVSISTSFNRMAADLRRFRKELEIKTRRLEELNAEYRRLNEHLESEVEDKTRELKEFFSVVTHDMRVPLAAIQGYTDLLLRSRSDALSEKHQRFVHAISTACSHLLELTRNMMQSVKYDAGKITYYVEDFDLAELAGEIKSQVAHGLEEKGISLAMEIPPRCRPVCGDRTKIGQVVSNLLNNAVKFTSEGGSISLRARDRGRQVEVTVSDTGTGIEPDQVPLLFEKFTQFQTIEGATSSIGLGLYIVRKILEGHQQTIKVMSTPGQGSSFIFTLDKAAGAAPSGGDEEPKPVQIAGDERRS